MDFHNIYRLFAWPISFCRRVTAIYWMAAAPLRHAISAIVFSICYVTTIHAYPQGAPSGSCTALYPHHSTASQSLASSPFVLDISAFAADGGYVQGKTYKSKSVESIHYI